MPSALQTFSRNQYAPFFGGHNLTNSLSISIPGLRLPNFVLVLVIDLSRTRNLELIAPDAAATTEPKGHINQEKLPWLKY